MTTRLALYATYKAQCTTLNIDLSKSWNTPGCTCEWLTSEIVLTTKRIRAQKQKLNRWHRERERKQQERERKQQEQAEEWTRVKKEMDDIERQLNEIKEREAKKKAPEDHFREFVYGSEYYKLLDVQPGATKAQIKKAYHKQSLIYHPDKGGNEDTFKRILTAYEFLSK